MGKSREIVFDFVPQGIKIDGKGTWTDHFRVRIPDEFKPPKELVFRDDASLLTPAQKDIFQGVIDGGTNRQIAFKLNISHKTVKNHITKIGRQLRNEGFDIPKSSGGVVRRTAILALLQSGELELRDPK
ncbi:helix-turn-helix transcriptional regulator [Patescibacteria group bacterium]|nr:helix-turn-helix transcriptional regulator [Patescibacteria group bacterium]